jgi:hypothetical protein
MSRFLSRADVVDWSRRRPSQPGSALNGSGDALDVGNRRVLRTDLEREDRVIFASGRNHDIKRQDVHADERHRRESFHNHDHG